MESFFLFGGLEKLSELPEREGGDHEHDDLHFSGEAGREFNENVLGDDDEEFFDDEDIEAERRLWQERLRNHDLVREARRFERLTLKLVGHLQPVVSAPAYAGRGKDRFAKAPKAEPVLRVKDREALKLARCVGHLPASVTEALIAEATGQQHRDCSPECVAYDVEWFAKSRRVVRRALMMLEELLRRYPAQVREILYIIDQGRSMEATLGRRVFDMFALWMRKSARH
ncbi:MAG: hypothetical protein Q8R13_02375 [bacterium]|nr:hypothetical protein [bacterium]MDZ4296527.1 hypothetical protein [Patescibacteria group bacterium]